MTTIYDTTINYVDLAGLSFVGSRVYAEGPDHSYVDWKYWSQGGVHTDMPNPFLGSYPFPVPGGVQAAFINKCVDGVTGEWTFWETNFQDVNGTRYPGASFDAGTYRVLSIKYDREGV